MAEVSPSVGLLVELVAEVTDHLYSLQLWQEGRWVYQPPGVLNDAEFRSSLDDYGLKINGREVEGSWRIVRDDGLIMASHVERQAR